MYMHYCKIEMYADRAGGICTMQGWGWYKILGRSESQAVKKPSNRGVATLVREHTAHPLHWLSDRLHNNIMEVNKGEG